MAKIAMAVVAHPDDIELMMGGTFIRLGDAGYELHYMTIGNGSCGSATMDAEETVRMRTQEAKNAANMVGAKYHDSVVPDIEIHYEQPLIRKLCGIVREVKPEILLLPSPQDYMEDHSISCRLMVTAAFCRGMRNYQSDPPTPPVDHDMALYHALPWGLCDQLRNPVTPDFYVDITGVMDKKLEMLACHKSQRQWLDDSQGVDNYLSTMQEMSKAVGRMSGRYEYAEGWRLHSHLGFGAEDFDPLREVLRDFIAEQA
ncbi:MAG: PIG-L deacetylase family protein [Armatimonadota bacterium]